MRLEELQVEIRPRTAGQTLALATRLLQHRPGPLLGAWAFYTLASLGLGAFLFFYLKLPLIWVWLSLLILSPLFSTPLITSAGHLVFSPRVTFGLVAKATLQRVIPFSLLFLINRILTLIGVCFMLVPGLYLWRNSWFLGPIVLLEGSPLVASFQRGSRFALGFFGHVLGHAFHVSLLLGYLTLAFASLLHFFSVQVLGLSFPALVRLTLFDEYYPVLLLIGLTLALPFATLVWFFVYLDVRTRKEGWDLEIAFRARAVQLERTHG